jgi:N-methylhydantoinase B
MISAAKMGRDRYLALVEEYGLQMIQQAGEDLISYAEDLMRQKIRSLPDGEWHEQAYLDDDGRNRSYLDDDVSQTEHERRIEEARLTIDVNVEVEGDEITVDLTDSNDQVPTGFNCPVWGTTTVSVAFTLRAILMDTYVHDEYIPLNAGPLDPVTVETRDGSIFDPEPPASAYARIQQADLMGSLIVKALRNAIPGRVMAGDASQVFFTS